MQSQIVIGENLITYEYIKGQPDRGSIIFLHGWRSQKEIWNSVIDKLSVINNQLSYISIDLPGFGQSSTPSRVFGVGDYANAVAEFIKKLELKDIIIVGHSFGGRVAIKLASKYPGIASKLILVDAAGFVTKGFKRTLFRYAAKLVKPFFYFTFTQGLRKYIYQFIGAEDYVATPLLTQTFLASVNEDLTEDMKKISCPALIIWGEDDKETPLSFGKKMNSLIPNSKFVVLPNSGHFSFLDKSEEFAKALLNFVSSRT